MMKTIASATPYRAVKSSIVLGKPGHNCAGNGICKVLPMYTRTGHWTCLHTQAEFRYTNGRLSMHFSRDICQIPALAAHFKHTHFLIEEDFPLPLWLIRALGIAPHTLSAGAYEISFSGNRIQVLL